MSKAFHLFFSLHLFVDFMKKKPNTKFYDVLTIFHEIVKLQRFE